MRRLRALPEAKQQRWGALHAVTFRHPLATLGTSYAGAFNLGPVERPGDANTPNNPRYDESYQQVHGATYRHLFDLADWDRALATSAPGQSGQPVNPHYGDLLPLWSRGEYFPLAWACPSDYGLRTTREPLLGAGEPTGRARRLSSNDPGQRSPTPRSKLQVPLPSTCSALSISGR